MYDPLELTKITERVVVRGREKKYFRFRFTRFYGCSATADSVGCNLRCIFCWSGRAVREPNRTGRFYPPEEVVDRLVDIASKNRCRLVRISGAEPTIGRGHLLSILDLMEGYNLTFILETNGILLGYDRGYVEALSGYKNLHVRVSIKGCDKEEFRFLTRARYGFSLQIKSLEYLSDYGISFHPSVVSVFGREKALIDTLKDMGIKEGSMEWEKLRLYPPVKERLKRMGVLKIFKDVCEDKI